jgi:hypothetical protein
VATLFARHKVADYSSWRQKYDDFDTERRSMGVTDDGVYQLDGDPNDVTIFHEFNTLETAKSFANSDRLREVMAEAGVLGEPDIWFTTRH